MEEGDGNCGLDSAATLQNEALTRFHFRVPGLPCLVQKERTSESWEVTVTRAGVTSRVLDAQGAGLPVGERASSEEASFCVRILLFSF